MRHLSAAEINALAARPVQQGRMEPPAAVDRSRPFVPEEYTQLFYTPVYATLGDAERLRYNQLFALRINEYIMMLEHDLIERLLPALCGHGAVRGDAALVAAIDVVVEEERRHFRGFAALNRACHPALYPSGSDRYFSRLPWWTHGMFQVVGLAGAQLPFALWFLMAMEESSKSLARDMQRQPRTATLGELDPAFTRVHLEHLKDETRHVHLDLLLVDRCLQGPRQGMNAWLFMQMLAGVIRPTRAGSGAKVIRRLVEEMPHLAPREEEMIQAVLALRGDRAFQTSLFNRRIMPQTFAVFDRCPALAGLGNKMVGYDRQPA